MKASTQNRKLGRGLSALIGESKIKQEENILNQRSRAEHSVSLIALDKIVAGVYQPRKTFNQEEIEDLSHSIKENGLIQPIILRRADDDDHYEIIAGERRFRASKLAGLDKIPSIIKKINNHEALELAIVENVQRSDLSLTEEALGYQQLIEEFSYTQAQVSKRVGKSRSHITNLLRLLTLPKATQDLLDQKLISMGHARAIINSKNPELLAKKVVDESLTVRNVEDLVRDERIEKVQTNGLHSQIKSHNQLINSHQLSDIENELAEILNTKVKISYNAFKQNGKITINFSHIEEIQRLIKNLTQ